PVIEKLLNTLSGAEIYQLALIASTVGGFDDDVAVIDARGISGHECDLFPVPRPYCTRVSSLSKGEAGPAILDQVINPDHACRIANCDRSFFVVGGKFDLVVGLLPGDAGEFFPGAIEPR